MKHEVETELKVLLSREDFEKLASRYAPLHFEHQHNIYFVTNDIKHYAFRIREKNGEKLFTLKEHKDGKTIEHEKVFTGELEDDPEIREVLAGFEIFPPYKVIGELDTERAVYDTGKAELCFDINNYNGITDYEIEYEIYKDHKYKKAFNKIMSEAEISYDLNKVSKYKRCVNTLKEPE